MLKILQIICGSIAAYKGLEIIRLLKAQSHEVEIILTAAGSQFISPLSCSSLSQTKTHTDLFALGEKNEMLHIHLARASDILLIAPASANIIAKLANGIADDLASTTLLTGTNPVYIAPAMNVEMWLHPATQENVKRLKDRGITFIGPEEGTLACQEFGFGKMASPEQIVQTLMESEKSNLPLSGYTALVTAGPTQEHLDPIRFISNHSSGKQGYAIAEALAQMGAEVTLISGPTSLAQPKGLKEFIPITSAAEMLEKCLNYLPRDIAVCTAAVTDWYVHQPSSQKIKKSVTPPAFAFSLTADILKTLSGHKKRPRLIIGFAAETEQVINNAQQKRTYKGCDWILANDVSNGTFGSEYNQVHFIDEKRVEDWPFLTKKEVAYKLGQKIASHFGKHA